MKKSDRKLIFLKQPVPVLVGIISFILLGVTVFAAGQPAAATNPQSLFFSGNNAYQSGDFAKAASLYQQLADSGYESGNLYYNLGNAYIKTGQKGMAALYYEKARELMPADADLRANLEFIRSGQEELDVDWKLALFDYLSHLAALDQLLVFTSVWFFIMVILLSLAVLFRAKLGDLLKGNLKSWWYGLVITGSLMLIGGTALTGLTAVERSLPKGIVIKAGGEVRFGPQPETTVYYQLGEGLKVRILEEKQGWVLVRRADGKRGWTEKQFIKKL